MILGYWSQTRSSGLSQLNDIIDLSRVSEPNGTIDQFYFHEVLWYQLSRSYSLDHYIFYIIPCSGNPNAPIGKNIAFGPECLIGFLASSLLSKSLQLTEPLDPKT